MSFLNSSTEVKTTRILKPHITKTQVLRLLHNADEMIVLNPIIKSYSPVPESSAKAFFSKVAAENMPGVTASTMPTVYAVVESMDSESAADGASWRGGWAKRFVPESITYETSMQKTDDGMIAITHAPMGVSSVTKWLVRDAGKQGEGLVLEEIGKVQSNRMLMTFIKTTISGSYEKLANDFVIKLEAMIEEEEREKAKLTEEEHEKVTVKEEEQEIVVQSVA